MNTLLEAALAPPGESSYYRRLRWVPSVRAVGEHMSAYAAHWRGAAADAIADGGPALVVLGDSLAQGIGASSPATSYAGLLRADLSKDGEFVGVLNLSRSGARVADVLETQLPALAASVVTPIAIVCTVGSNDILHSFRLGEVRRGLLELVDSLPDDAVVATLPEKGSRVGASMNRTIRERAATTGRPVADVGRALRTWRGRVSGDGFHPNDDGHAVWFEAFAAALRQTGRFADGRPCDGPRTGPPLAHHR